MAIAQRNKQPIQELWILDPTGSLRCVIHAPAAKAANPHGGKSDDWHNLVVPSSRYYELVPLLSPAVWCHLKDRIVSGGSLCPFELLDPLPFVRLSFGNPRWYSLQSLATAPTPQTPEAPLPRGFRPMGFVGTYSNTEVLDRVRRVLPTLERLAAEAGPAPRPLPLAKREALMLTVVTEILVEAALPMGSCRHP